MKQVSSSVARALPNDVDLASPQALANPSRVVRLAKASWVRWVILVCVAALSALAGIRSSLTSIQEDRRLDSDISGVYSDGWMGPRVLVQFPDAAGAGNRITFSLDGWRPPAAGPANLEIRACGRPVFSGALPSGRNPIAFYLPFGCQSPGLELITANPFVEPNNSGRMLSVKFKSVTIDSVFGPPIPKAARVWILLGGAIAAALAVWVILMPIGGRLLWTLFYAVALGWSLSCHQLPDVVTFLWWCALGIGIAAGARLGATEFTEDRSARHLSSRWYAVGVTALVMAGLAIRVYGIDFGLPEWYHPDEVKKMGVILTMHRLRTFNPDYFLHPSLLLYLSELLSHAVVWWKGSPDLTPVDAVLAGRLVSACAGSLSILALYLLGKELYDRRVGFVAAALLSFFPLHVTCSRYLKEDALLTLWIVLAALFFARAVRSSKWGDIALLIVSCGLASGTKYSGVLTALMPAILPWFVSGRLMPDWKAFRRALALSPLLPLTFVATTPYSILSSPKFLAGLAFERTHLAEGHGVIVTPWQYLWTFHVQHSLAPGMTYPVFMLSLLALGFLLVRRNRNDVVILMLVALFYLPAEAVSSKPPPQPDRYVLPCLPFLALASAEFLAVLLGLLRASSLRILFAGLVVLIPLARTSLLASELRLDTRQIMDKWMRENIPAGATVYIAGGFAPRLKHTEFEAYRDQSREADANPVARTISDFDYVLLSSLHYDRYFELPYSKELKRRYGRLLARPVVKKVEPQFGTYGFHNPTVVLVRMKEAQSKDGEGPAAQ